jgi:hypothetical protein
MKLTLRKRIINQLELSRLFDRLCCRWCIDWWFLGH